jgi:hypothetical protein
VRFDRFNARNVPQRLVKLKVDPWADIARQARPLTQAVMAKVGFEP